MIISGVFLLNIVNVRSISISDSLLKITLLRSTEEKAPYPIFYIFLDTTISSKPLL